MAIRHMWRVANGLDNAALDGIMKIDGTEKLNADGCIVINIFKTHAKKWITLKRGG
jgi:hypothetical protein